MLYIAGIVITIFLCLLLFTKKNKTEADLILALWLFFIALHNTNYQVIWLSHHNRKAD